jgi:hypothetical protein
MTLKTSTLERVLSGMLISDRLWLKSIYESTRDVVEADGLVGSPAIVKLADWLEIHQSIKKFIWYGMRTVCPNLYGELLTVIDREIIAAVLPHYGGEVTPEVRRRLVSVLDRVAWAGLGGDE